MWRSLIYTCVHTICLRGARSRECSHRYPTPPWHDHPMSMVRLIIWTYICMRGRHMSDTLWQPCLHVHRRLWALIDLYAVESSIKKRYRVHYQSQYSSFHFNLKSPRTTSTKLSFQRMRCLLYSIRFTFPYHTFQIHVWDKSHSIIHNWTSLNPVA